MIKTSEEKRIDVKAEISKEYDNNGRGLWLKSGVTVHDVLPDQAEFIHINWLHKLETWADNYMATRPQNAPPPAEFVEQAPPQQLQQRTGGAYMSDSELKEALKGQVAELNRRNMPDAWNKAVKKVCGQHKRIDDMSESEKARLHKYLAKVLMG